MTYTRSPYQEVKYKIVIEHLEKFKDTPSHAIAKILFRDYPKFWNNVESVRSVIRLYRGRSGARDKEKVKMRKYYV